MNGDQAASVVAAIAMLVLVGSSLAARRLPMRTMVRLAAIWVAIFGGLYLLVRAFPAIRLYFT